MTKLRKGVRVSHPDYGDGTVVQTLGNVIRVDFFGDHIDVEAGDLVIAKETIVDVADDLASPLTRQKYFTSIEAINLGGRDLRKKQTPERRNEMRAQNKPFGVLLRSLVLNGDIFA